MKIFVLGILGGLGISEIIILLLILALLLLPLIALISVLKSQFKNNNDKIIWVVLVLLLPILGAILYFAIGRKQRINQ